MPLNSDDQNDLTRLVPPLPTVIDDGFSKRVITRTRLVEWRYSIMRMTAWTCLALSLAVLVPWQTIMSVIHQYTMSILMQSLEQAGTLSESLQASFDQPTDVGQPGLVATAVLIMFAVAIIGLLAED